MQNQGDEISTPLVERIKDKVKNIGEGFRIGDYHKAARGEEVDRVFTNLERIDAAKEKNETPVLLEKLPPSMDADSAITFKEQDGNLRVTMHTSSENIKKLEAILSNGIHDVTKREDSITFVVPIEPESISNLDRVARNAGSWSSRSQEEANAKANSTGWVK